MNKETKSKCCVHCYSNSEYYGVRCIPDKYCKCHTPKEDTPITPIEPSWVERFDEKVKELKDQRPSLYKIADVVEFGYSVDRDDELFRVVDFGNIKKFIHSVEKAAEEKARRETIRDIAEMLENGIDTPMSDLIEYARVKGISLQAK